MLALSRSMMGAPMRGRRVAQRKGMLKRREERMRLKRIQEGTSSVIAGEVEDPEVLEEIATRP